jgi:hypothetical protein
MANDLGLAAGAGGGMAYKLFQDLLLRRFTEQQAALKQQNAETGFGLDRERLGLDRSKLGEDARQFNEAGARSDRQFSEQASTRVAQARNLNANADKDIYDISPGKRTADMKDRLTEIEAQGKNQRAVAGIRQRDRYQLQDAVDEKTHQPIKVRVDLDTGEATPVRVIGGNIRVGKGKTLTPQQQGEVGSYDSVLKESSRILDLLHKSGLDKENNPINPRMRSYIAQKLKVNGSDPVVDQVIQNIGYLQTVALRSAAGNQRLTHDLMETFKPHIGDTESSGARIATILPELQRQIGDRRANLYRLAGVDDPNEANAANGDAAAKAQAMIDKYRKQ